MKFADPFDSIRSHSDSQFGSVTKMIRAVDENSPDAQEHLFAAVIEQLQSSARSVLRQFPNVRGVEEDVLVNEIYESLLKKLLSKDIKNREHFFGTACIHFRWVLLDLVKRKNLETEPLFEDQHLSTQQEVALDNVEFLTFAFEQLDKISPELRTIVDNHILLGMTFDDIAELMKLSKSTVYDRFNEALAILREQFEIH